MSTSMLTPLASSSSFSRKTCSLRRWTMAPDRRSMFSTLLVIAAFAGCGPGLLSRRLLADEGYQERVERLQKMSPEEKEDLQRKKKRFDELPEAEKDRLRELYAAITIDPQSEALSETIRRYNRWLATLSSAQRSDV